MLRFEYFFELKEGYVPVMEMEEETGVKFVIEAENRVTADRMVKALLKGSVNIESYSGVCVCDID